MAKPTVDEFRRNRLCVSVFAATSIFVIQDAINEAYNEYGIRGTRRCIYAAAHLLALEDDDIRAMEGDAWKAVDLGTGGLLAKDTMDGSRRTIGQTGAGVEPGVVGGLQDDVFWATTRFGRRVLDLERRLVARRPMTVLR